MDFKSLLNKIDSVQTRPETPAAPVLPSAVQLNEDAQLRVLSGRTTYVAEAKKMKEEEKKEKEVSEEMKVGDTKNISTGTVTKTKTGIVHKSSKAYGGSEEKADDSDDEPKKKKAKKESIDAEAFRGKFAKMVESKKKSGKPDFLDMDKDGDKKEPMKKAVADKKAGPKKGVNPFAKKDESVKEAAVKEISDETKKSYVKKASADVGKMATGEKDGGKMMKRMKGIEKAQESVTRSKKVVAESVDQKLTFKQMIKLVQESGGQQQIDATDKELFAWAQRVATAKFNEGTKAEVYAGLVYERMGGAFEMYDVLSEDQK